MVKNVSLLITAIIVPVLVVMCIYSHQIQSILQKLTFRLKEHSDDDRGEEENGNGEYDYLSVHNILHILCSTTYM